MSDLKTIIFNTQIDCCLCIGTECTELYPGVPFVMHMGNSSKTYYSVWPKPGDPSRIGVPIMHSIEFKDGKLVSAAANTLDWGDVIETTAEPAWQRLYEAGLPRTFDSAEFLYRDKKAIAELYFDQVVRLSITPDGGEPFSLAFGGGERGSLNVIDMGRARLLCVKIEQEQQQRMIMLDRGMNLLLDVCADSVGIINGRPFKTVSLGTFRNHERTVVYEYSGGAFEIFSETIRIDPDKSREPETDAQRALTFIEELYLDGIDTWKDLLAGDLKSASAESEFKEFFGSVAKVYIYPIEEPYGRATIGIVRDIGLILRPEKYRFDFEASLITDITEL